MTEAQREVLLGLNLRAMQMADSPGAQETGVFTREVAEACGRSTRSTAVVLSQMRDFRWVESRHGADVIGWALTARGVAALEVDRSRTPFSDPADPQKENAS